jgi:tRNA A-37 threonylcarbamoyl transferase component Bud32
MFQNVLNNKTLEERLSLGTQSQLKIKDDWLIKTYDIDSKEKLLTEYQFLKKSSQKGISPQTIWLKNKLHIKLIKESITLLEVIEGYKENLFSYEEVTLILKESICQFNKLHKKMKCIHGDARVENVLVYLDKHKNFKVLLIDFGEAHWINNWKAGASDFYSLFVSVIELSAEFDEVIQKCIKELGYPNLDTDFIEYVRNE